MGGIISKNVSSKATNEQPKTVTAFKKNPAQNDMLDTPIDFLQFAENSFFDTLLEDVLSEEINSSVVASLKDVLSEEIKSIIDKFIESVQVQNISSIDRERLDALKPLIIAKHKSIKECINTTNYLKVLFDQATPEFNVAIQIMLQSEQIWHLNTESLHFFYLLRANNVVAFDRLLNTFKILCTDNSTLLSLQTHHIETAIDSLQRNLAPQTWLSLELYLDKHAIDVGSIARALRDKHTPYLLEQARTNCLLHHSQPHALEIFERTKYFTTKVLGLLNSDDPRDIFLLAILGLMIEFHDHEQKIKGSYPSIEHATAARIAQWLIERLPTDPSFDIKRMVDYMAHYVIVLGTTMIYSPVSTMDLYELFCIVELAATDAGMHTIDSSNTMLDNTIKAVTLVTGLCDKNPAALLPVVVKQESKPDTATRHILRQYFNTPLVLDLFFAGCNSHIGK